MFLPSIAYISGVVLLQQSSALPGLGWLLPALILVACTLRFKTYKLLAWFVFGWAWALLYSSSILENQLHPKFEGQTLSVRGSVIGLPEGFSRGVRFAFRLESINGITDSSMPKTIRLSWYSLPVEIRPGDRWQFTVRLKRPHGNYNPHGFDYEQWLFENHYRATGYVKQGRLLQRDNAWTSWDSLRYRLNVKLSESLDGRPMQGIIKALVIGHRNQITAEQWQVFRATGTGHLVAISGLHIGILAGIGFFFSRWLWAWLGQLMLSPQTIGTIGSVFFAGTYAALAGFSYPTQRAFIMVVVVMTAIIGQRFFKPLHSLGMALLAVGILNPLSVLSPGLWLSFFAVAFILYISTARVASLGKGFLIRRVNLVTAVGLSPLLILYFQQVSLIAPLANVLAVPLMSLVIVPICLLGSLLLMIWTPAGDIILAVADSLLQALWVLLDGSASLAFSQIYAQPPSIGIVLLSIGGILLLFAPRGIPARWLGCFILLPLLYIASTAPQKGEFKFTLLDVGQGLAAVIETHSHTLVFDTGARYSKKFDMGSAVVTPFLRGQGVHKIDALIISHGDNDHIGGLSSVISQFEITQVYSSVPEQIQGRSVTRCQAGQRWSHGETVLNFLTRGFHSWWLRIFSHSQIIKYAAHITSKFVNR